MKMEDWKFGPPILVGERVLWVKNTEKPLESGVVRWIGKLSKESKDWTVGIELDKTLPYGGTDGSWGDRKLFHCSSRKGVFLPLSRIRKEVPKVKLKNIHVIPLQTQHESISSSLDNVEDKEINLGISKERNYHYERGENNTKMESKMAGRTIKELPNWINKFNEEGHISSDSDDRKSDVRKSFSRRRRRSLRPGVARNDLYSGQNKTEVKRPFSITDKIIDNDCSKDNLRKKHESCALEEKYIREFIQREIKKQQGLQSSKEEEEEMNDVKGNFKRIDEDDISAYESNNLKAFQYKSPKRCDIRIGRRSDAFHRREKSSGFFSFLKWFKKSKEMPELEQMKDSSVTSSPIFTRRRSSSCGSVDTLFSIATANSFAFVSPLQYQAVISSSHTTYPVPSPKADDDIKNKSQSDYENNPSPVKDSEEVKTEGHGSTEKKKKSRAPDPPRESSLPSTLEYKKSNDDNDDDSDGKNGHRRTVSESFKDKKAGYYCHVQGKRKAPLPPASGPLYPSLTSLKNQCPSIGKKKRPAPPPPDARENDSALKDSNVESAKANDGIKNTSYDNIPFHNPKLNEESAQKEVLKPVGINLSPLLGLTNDLSSSPLPSRPWYKRSSSAGNILKKESVKLSDRKKNKENEEWMPEVGFSRRPISNDSSHNLFNLLSRLDKNQEKKKDEKRKSQISILANISELDREAAEIVRKEHAQEKKMLADKDEKYYTSNINNNVLASFPAIQDYGQETKASDKQNALQKVTKSPFDEFRLKQGMEKPNSEKTKITEEPKEEYDTSAELDYYINPWNCPKCTLENPGWEKFCEACNTMRVKFRADVLKRESGNAAEVKLLEEKPKESSPPITESKTEKLTRATNDDQEDPAEDNLEGVRRKRLAFFASKKETSHDGAPEEQEEEEEDEKAKLKIMLKEMKNSLPKREKEVKNNATSNSNQEETLDEQKSVPTGNILDSWKMGEADSKAKEFSKSKVHQTWQESDSNKYGAIKKVSKCEPVPSTTAEAIIVTKTTILEDIIMKKVDKGPKVSTSVQTNATTKNEKHNNRLVDVPKKDDLENHAYVNIKNIKEKSGIVDLSTSDSTIANGDIEAITAKLQKDGTDPANYKVDVQSTSSLEETLDVNRLLRKLEAAINTGQHLEAANLAKELARMKINCSVKRQRLVPDTSKIIIDLYVEDKLTHKGPIQIQILPSITLGQLKMKVEREWDIPRNVQRWILGKQLATDDDKTLEQHGVVSNSCPLFLYIVTPEQTCEKTENASRNLSEPARRNGRISAVYAEARRPSLIIEEDGESACEEAEHDNGEKYVKRDNIEESWDVKQKKLSPESPKLSTVGSKRREMFQRRDSQTCFSFEKREMNENLKNELKVISANSVKERIEKLNRAATGSSAEVPESSRKAKNDNRAEGIRQKWHYNELMELENADLVPNAEEFECPICLVEYTPGEGVVLKDCLHVFCRTCLVNTIQFNEEAEVKCPYRDENYSCESVLQQREIKSLVPKRLFEQHLAKSVSVAENTIGNAYHCKTPDCKGWCILEDNVNEFRCPVCRMTNCLTCHAIHMGANCRQYQEQIQFASDTNVEAKKTRDMLLEMVEKGEAMACPTCQVVLMKKWGCDWLRCSMCKTEICWVTRGPRWGPGGKGDTSGGCHCGLNGIKCHPKCNYCH